MRWHCCTVEWSCRNPNWWLGIQSCWFKSLLIYLSIIFSGIFEIVGSKLIGRYDETSIGFFPGLCIIIIGAVFNDLGQYSSRSMALNIYIRFTGPSFLQCCTHHTPNTSWFLYHTRSLVGKLGMLYIPLFWPSNQFYVTVWAGALKSAIFASASGMLSRPRFWNMRSHLRYVVAQSNQVVTFIFMSGSFLQVFGQQNTSHRGFEASFLWPLMGYSDFHKNQTTEGGYELT